MPYGQDDLKHGYGQDPLTGGDSNLGSAAAAIDPGPFIRGAGNFVRGVGQGLIGPPEALYQWGGGTLPKVLQDYQDRAESSGAGIAGEIVGNIPPFLLGGEVLDALGIGSKLPAVARWAMRNPRAATTLSTAGQSTIAQPSKATNWPDFLKEKAEDAGLGAILGRLLGRPIQRAAHETAEATNAPIRTANEASAQANKLFDESLAEKNRLAAAGATTEAQQATNALKAAPAPVDPRKAVPTDTTSGWWARTLEQAGVPDATVRAAPETGAKVQNAVGGRLNDIMGGMHLDSNDPALLDHLNDIRDETERALPENERAGWYHEEPEEPLGAITNPATGKTLVSPTGKPLERTTRGVREKEPKPPTGTFYRTVIAPLKQAGGTLTGQELTNYVSRIGARAEELAREAATVPRERRVVLQAQADALRNVEDSIIGHAAGSPEQKLALEQARRAYMMWSVGNDAARAQRNGVANPAQLISALQRRMGPGGRGLARYNQALNDPKSPYHDLVTWLQGQQAAHTADVPKAGAVTPVTPRSVTPERRSPQFSPPMDTERPLVYDPGKPNYPKRGIPSGTAQIAAGAALTPWHPFVGPGLIGSGLRSILGRTGGDEGSLERVVRRALQNRPRVQRGARGATAATAEQARRNAPTPGDVIRGAAKIPEGIKWAWGQL
jgi:hypothetical protein